MIGKIFITSSGYDPDCGKPVKDPYLGPTPTLGICRRDLRKAVRRGDWVFTITGKVPRRGVPQYVMGGFQVAEKITASEAYERFPNLRLHRGPDGLVTGNVIVDAHGNRHPLDHHDPAKFESKLDNYLVGSNPICLSSPEEVAIARAETLETLCRILGKVAPSPFRLIGRSAKTLDEAQLRALRMWLGSISVRAERKAG
jgi:hypothetical protein